MSSLRNSFTAQLGQDLSGIMRIATQDLSKEAQDLPES
jgi:hypothetical protein